MTLRKKTAIIFGIVLSALLLALLFALSFTLLEGFADLEERDTVSNVRQALNVIDDYKNNFSKDAQNWASRDDTYAFMENRNQSYIDSNLLLDSNWKNNHVNMMAFVNAAGDAIHVNAYDLNEGKLLEVSAEIDKMVIDNPALRANPSTEKGGSCLVMLPEGPMLVASQPVLTGSGEGPARGTLIWGRYLDADDVSSISRTAGLTLHFFRYDDASLPQDVSDSLAGMTPDSPIAVKALNSDMVAGYTVFNDVYQAPALILRVETPRTIYQQGRSTLGYTFVSLLLSGIVFCGISLFLVERTVLSRISRISADVEDIGRLGEPSSRLDVSGSDELSKLGGGINKMLSNLERSRQAQLETSKKEMSRRKELASLYDLSRSLADTKPDVDAILGLVTRHAVETIHVTYAQVVLLEGNDLVVRAAHPRRALGDLHIGQRVRKTSQPFTMKVMRQNEPQTIRGDWEFLTKAERNILFHGAVSTACIVPLRIGDRTLGIIAFGEHRSEEREPFSEDKIRLSRSIGEQTASALRQAELFDELESTYLQTVLALANAVEAKDTYTINHAQKLAIQATAIGKEMHLSESELEDLRYGSILHDIGKIGMPDSILQKTGRLNEDEWRLMKQHPVIGEHILVPVPRLRGAAKIVRSHHERFDGSGYPDGLAGDRIPIGARILAAVDSFGAMKDKRVYKEALPHNLALLEIERYKGTQFDPAVVEIFMSLVERGVID